MDSRVDLHVHSKYSNRPSEWLLRRIGSPECYTEPGFVYRTAKRRGMSFVTISDHDCISGALEIAHHPDAFLSDEITTYFPEDGCKIHLLAWDIDEPQFEEIQRLRPNIYELRDYLHLQGIAHSCAHPLYSINDRLTLDHLEKLLLLFNVFEGMNGGRSRRGNDLVLAILNQLTAGQLDDMGTRQKVAPKGEKPWIKGLSGGSDDHCGTFVAKGFTSTASACSIQEFLAQVAGRKGRPGGLDGTSLSFAHSLYTIGYQYYRDKFLASSWTGGDPTLKILGEFFGKEARPAGIKDRMSYYAYRMVGRKEKTRELEFKRTISKDLVSILGEDWSKDDFVADPDRFSTLNRRTFALSCKISNELLFRFFRKFVKRISEGKIFGSLEALSALGPVLLGIAPYLFSFTHYNRDRQFLCDVRQHFLGVSDKAPSPKRAWFTDTLHEINGVSTLITKMAERADLHRHDLTLISVARQAPAVPGRIRNFAPVGEFTLPENDQVKLAFPPVLDLLEYCEQEEFTEFIISTPALAGLGALVAGKILNRPMIGIYHTDLPQYIRYYTDDDSMESLAWRYLAWFYDQMDVVLVPSQVYRRQLLAKGFDGSKIRLFPHGTDTEAFHPSFRDEEFWLKYGGNGGPKVTYVGRLAREKDLDVLVDTYRQLAQRQPEWTLAVVGDGPYLSDMKNGLAGRNVIFTGFLLGEELSRAYASSDVFVFPSTTDTFGNVVLEAMASGVPVVVSDRGGPKEIVQPGRTGIVTPARSSGALVEAIENLIENRDFRSQMSRNCRRFAETRSWDKSYLGLWHGN